jgi:hypothetical protein
MKKTAFLVLMICALIEARGQKVSDPRSSSFWSKPQQLGISLGFGGIMQTGTMIADECNCSFENGGGMSSAFALTFENELAKNVVWGLGAEYRFVSMDSRYQELEILENQRTSSGALVNMEVPFRHNAAFSTSMIGIMPYIKVFPFDTRLFARFGLNIGSMVTASLTHTKELLQKRTILATGETVEFSLDPNDPRVKGNIATIQDGDITQLNSLFLGGHIGVGAEFRAGKKLIFGPTMMYIIPFTSVSSYPGSDFSFNNLQIAIEARISLD